jgi:hypothetical protein
MALRPSKRLRQKNAFRWSECLVLDVFSEVSVYSVLQRERV